MSPGSASHFISIFLPFFIHFLSFSLSTHFNFLSSLSIFTLSIYYILPAPFFLFAEILEKTLISLYLIDTIMEQRDMRQSLFRKKIIRGKPSISNKGTSHCILISGSDEITAASAKVDNG